MGGTSFSPAAPVALRPQRAVAMHYLVPAGDKSIICPAICPRRRKR